MRVPPPPSVKLQREALLRDVRARLEPRLPRLARKGEDASDPAWILLEQAAWMVERLSDQLDRYPFAALQQLFHVVGGELLPALPALGVLVAAPDRSGLLSRDPNAPDTTRFFSARTERASSLEFVSVEDAVPVAVAEIASVAVLDQEELWAVQGLRAEGPLGPLSARLGEARRATLFDGEEIRFAVATAGAETAAALGRAVKAVEARGIGWLQLSVAQEAADRVVVTARFDLDALVERAAGGPELLGGDLPLPWGNLDGTDWTPPVRFGDANELPPNLRGRRVEGAALSGTLLLRGLPAGIPAHGLLRRTAAPVPNELLRAIWRTIQGRDTSALDRLRPTVRRSFRAEAGDDEPAWANAALSSNTWKDLQRRFSCLFHVRWLREALRPPDAAPLVETIRVAFVLNDLAAEQTPEIAVFALESQDREKSDKPRHTKPDRMGAEPLPHRIAWQIPLPSGDAEARWVLVTALDIPVPAESIGVVVALGVRPSAVLCNPLLVVQAPAVRDGRLWTVQRNVPEPVSLLHEDLVSGAVLDRLADSGLPGRTGALLGALPLAQLEVDGTTPISRWEGVAVDASAGQVLFNAPDARGVTRELRPGQRIKLTWYRRTDGAWGNLPGGAIHLVEQEPRVTPRLIAASNPLPTWHGLDRERPEAAVERLFAPTGGIPVLPADYEHLVRQVLGRRASRWIVRCWTYLERTLFPWALWPLPGAEPDEAERADLARWLREAGPDQVLIALGPERLDVPDRELELVRREVEAALAEWTRRLPRLRGSRVTRLWPLVAEGLSPEQADAAGPWPRHDLDGAAGALVDGIGRRAAAPAAVQLLNAAVVSARAPRPEGP